jgi:predicted esterase YcpF (UPF0227 family)
MPISVHCAIAPRKEANFRVVGSSLGGYDGEFLGKAEFLLTPPHFGW